MKKYTLKELSYELEINVRTLKKHISDGTLNIRKIGRRYWVTSEELERFMETSTADTTRNYLCKHYDNCLDRAARLNQNFCCEGCSKFIQAEKQQLTSLELDGMYALWKSVFSESLSAH